MSGDEQDGAVKDFEADLEALEARADALLKGNLTLEEALRTFEEGVALYRRCSESLRKAEQRVTKLVEGLEGVSEVPFA